MTAIIDKNNFQQTGATKEVMPITKIKTIWKNYGWEVFDVDGHNFRELDAAFSKNSNAPKLLIANTVKGKGFSIMEKNNEWHHKIVTKKIFNTLIKEL